MVKAAILLEMAFLAAGTSSRMIDQSACLVAALQAAMFFCHEAALDELLWPTLLAQPDMNAKEMAKSRSLCIYILNGEVAWRYQGRKGSIFTDSIRWRNVAWKRV